MLGVLGLLALIAGIIYFTVDANQLPSFLGALHIHTHAKRKRRGEAAIVIAVVLWVIAGIVYYVDTRARSRTTTPPTVPAAPQS
ncbi:MAG TPA: hypothetical protein VMB72_16060 [Acidimicrobiales bacterium]|nr:hypothetical protein [Acidimicrobiales bacterium]